MKLIETLATTAWAMHHFGGVCSGGRLKLRDLRNAESKGLVRSRGISPLCDGDGFTIHPERYRDAFELTPEGEAKLREADPETADFYLGSKQ